MTILRTDTHWHSVLRAIYCRQELKTPKKFGNKHTDEVFRLQKGLTCISYFLFEMGGLSKVSPFNGHVSLFLPFAFVLNLWFLNNSPRSIPTLKTPRRQSPNFLVGGGCWGNCQGNCPGENCLVMKFIPKIVSVEGYRTYTTLPSLSK